MVVIAKKWRGSFTVEATIVVSLFCMLISLTLIFGFYGHDRAVMKSTANDMALKGALWIGRYVSPTLFEVDYGAMERKINRSIDEIENLVYIQLERRLLYGKVQSVHVSHNYLPSEVRVDIVVDFKLWKIPVTCSAQSSGRVFESKDLPRNIKETGEKE